MTGGYGQDKGDERRQHGPDTEVIFLFFFCRRFLARRRQEAIEYRFIVGAGKEPFGIEHQPCPLAGFRHRPLRVPLHSRHETIRITMDEPFYDVPLDVLCVGVVVSLHRDQRRWFQHGVRVVAIDIDHMRSRSRKPQYLRHCAPRQDHDIVPFGVLHLVGVVVPVAESLVVVDRREVEGELASQGHGQYLGAAADSQDGFLVLQGCPDESYLDDVPGLVPPEWRDTLVVPVQPGIDSLSSPDEQPVDVLHGGFHRFQVDKLPQKIFRSQHQRFRGVTPLPAPAPEFTVQGGLHPGIGVLLAAGGHGTVEVGHPVVNSPYIDIIRLIRFYRVAVKFADIVEIRLHGGFGDEVNRSGVQFFQYHPELVVHCVGQTYSRPRWPRRPAGEHNRQANKQRADYF